MQRGSTLANIKEEPRRVDSEYTIRRVNVLWLFYRRQDPKGSELRPLSPSPFPDICDSVRNLTFQVALRVINTFPVEWRTRQKSWDTDRPWNAEIRQIDEIT